MTDNTSPWHSEPRPAFELTSPAPANYHLVDKVRQGKSAIKGALQAAIVAQAGIKPQRRPKPATPKTRR
jgi:hypothetical protein